MTRRAFQFWVLGLVGVYGLFIITGIALQDTDSYQLFKELIPLATALPAAILAGVYQRRSSFLQQLRSTWTNLIDVVQDGVQFTHLPKPDEKTFSPLMKGLSVIIEDFRSLFRNLNEDNRNSGFFPFESLKELQKTISDYYFVGDYSAEQRSKTRKLVISHWQQVRKPILEEFDRLEPTYFNVLEQQMHLVERGREVTPKKVTAVEN